MPRPPEAHLRIVDGLQREVETINGVESPAQASEFLLDHEGFRSFRDSSAPEELLVRETPEGMDVGLFVDAAALDELCRAPSWSARKLEAHAQALEGVSHFVYLTHRANHPRPVSQLELELQAEIDKFASVVLAVWREGRREVSSLLRERLFQRVSFRADLDAESRARYVDANALAHTFCRFLEARYVLRNSIDGFLAELRRMYRLGAGEKLSRAANPA